jgi:hypothetical protein
MSPTRVSLKAHDSKLALDLPLVAISYFFVLVLNDV